MAMGLMGFTETPCSSRPPPNNHRSLLSKSAGNGVWTPRISSVYPFYLFLICINGNSVCFNLREGTGCRAKEVPFFTPLTADRDDHLFWLLYGALSSGWGASPFKEGPPLSGHTKVPPDLHQTQDGALDLLSQVVFPGTSFFRRTVKWAQDGSVWREELAPRDLPDCAAGNSSLPRWFLSTLHIPPARIGLLP